MPLIVKTIIDYFFFFFFFFEAKVMVETSENNT